MTTNLVDTGFSNKNIVTGTSVYPYLVPLDGTYRIDILVHGVEASGTYSAWIENQLGSGSNSSILAPKTEHAADVNKGYFGFASISLDLKSNDMLNLMVDGLTGDTAVTGTVRIWRDNYSTITIVDILATVFEGAFTIQDFFRLASSVLFGKSTDGGTVNPKFRDLADTKNRISATVDTSGNRSSVNRDAT